jgi:methylmalonyl-CoA/ethylmalonyl-CoA epimerase
MKLGRLNHVGVATPSLDRAIAFWRETMGAEVIREPFDLPAQGVRACFAGGGRLKHPCCAL